MATIRSVIGWASLLVIAATAPAHADGTFTLGAGFSSDEGFLAEARIEQDDLFHTGQRLLLEARMTARTQEFLLEHEVRDLLGTGLALRTELFSRRKAYPGFVRDGVGGAMTVERQVGTSTRAYLRYRVEDVAVERDGGVPRAASPGRPVRDGGLIATLGAGVVHDTLDDPSLPYHGTRLELSGERADPGLGSTHDFVRLSARLDHARPLGPFTLRVHGAAGYIRARNGDVVPLSERFQHDGWADLPGYGFGSIGASTAGGDLEATGRVELELPVWRRAGLSVAAFADAGVLYNADPAYGPVGAMVHRAVGLSILWHSPIGVLRFDWAMPLDRRDGDDPVVFGFGVGF
jgi:outer membrane protein insertion porin family